MEACVDVDVEAGPGLKMPLEAVEVLEEEDHQFHIPLGMIEWTTCLKLHVEQEIDKDVICAMLLQIRTVLNVRHTYACSLTETASDHSTMKTYKLLIQILNKMLKVLMNQTQYH